HGKRRAFEHGGEIEVAPLRCRDRGLAQYVAVARGPKKWLAVARELQMLPGAVGVGDGEDLARPQMLDRECERHRAIVVLLIQLGRVLLGSLPRDVEMRCSERELERPRATTDRQI